MANIEIVIKIPEEVKQAFDCAKSNDLKDGYYDLGGVIGAAIKSGTLLPEHHGDLKDADKVESVLKNHAKSESEAWALVELLNVLDEVPTVLEATKEGDGE